MGFRPITPKTHVQCRTPYKGHKYIPYSAECLHSTAVEPHSSMCAILLIDICKVCLQDEMCYVKEDRVLAFLQDIVKLRPRSHLYIAEPNRTNIRQLALLCSVYHCFNREDVWQLHQSLIPHASELLVKSYMDFLIVQLAQAFIGNRFSHFSMDLFHQFRDRQKSAHFINELKCPPRKMVTYVGCQPNAFLDCCV